MKLHLGCGNRKIRGYCNIDIQQSQAVDCVCDITSLPFPRNSIDEIYSCAAIEHFSRHEWRRILNHWGHLLKPGCMIYLSTADFESCCVHYLENHDISKLIGLVNGGQKDDYDIHGMIFDFKTLKEGLESAGFENIQRYNWRDMHFYKDSDYDDYSSAYLPHGDKENGRLMMLNVCAVKK